MNSFHFRLWSKIIPRTNGCWEWQGSKDVNGYGRLSLHGRPHFTTIGDIIRRKTWTHI